MPKTITERATPVFRPCWRQHAKRAPVARLAALLSGLLLLAATLVAHAPQSQGLTITGTVTSDGAPLAGVTVTAVRAGGSAPAATSVTGADGIYRLQNLDAGVYRLEFSGTGVEGLVRPGVVLSAGLPAQVDASLRPVAGRDRVTSPSDINASLGPGEVAVKLETPFGFLFIAVDTKRAPLTAANFLKYVDGGFYDGGRFHRATRKDNYTPAPPDRPMMEIIQGGINPARRGDAFPPIPLERTSVTGLRHVAGTVSMARGTGADTATSDFFILLDDQPSLDFGGKRFEDGQGGAAFGRVVIGMDAVRYIQQQPVTGQNLTPPVPIVIASRVR